MGRVSSEVTKVQRAHQGPPSAPGAEVHSTPRDLPSTRTPPAGRALCAAPPVPLWVSQGTPQTTHPDYALCTPHGFSRGLEEATDHPTQDSPSGLRVGLPCPATEARSTGHAQPPHTAAHDPPPPRAQGQTAPPCLHQSVPREAAQGPGASQRCDPVCTHPPAPLQRSYTPRCTVLLPL